MVSGDEKPGFILPHPPLKGAVPTDVAVTSVIGFNGPQQLSL